MINIKCIETKNGKFVSEHNIPVGDQKSVGIMIEQLCRMFAATRDGMEAKGKRGLQLKFTIKAIEK